MPSITAMDWHRQLTAASGFLAFDLGMGQEAWDELEEMPPEDRARSEVVVMRLVILQSMQRWEKAARAYASEMQAAHRFLLNFLWTWRKVCIFVPDGKEETDRQV
jgi:hypothetical protein